MSDHFEYEPDKLIDEVRKRPGLWDPENKDYRAKKIRARLWNEIVAEIVGSTELSKSDLRELELQIQKKWKGFRDTFLKYVSRPEKWKHPYMHAQRLEFLLNCIHSRTSKTLPLPEAADTASTGSEEEQKARIDWRQKRRKIKLARESDDDEFDAPCDNSEAFAETPQVTNIVGSRPYGDEFMFANVESQRGDHDDPDKMFLLSLLPHLKAVPERNRLSVKMDMMQVLRNSQ